MLRQLAGQTLIYGMSSIVARLLNYLLVPYLTRILVTSEYGVYTDMYALIPFALVLLTMGMETSYFRFAGRAENALQKRDVFATTWGAVSSMALIFMVLVLLFKGDIASVTGYADRSSFIWIIGSIIALDVITAIPFARLREQGLGKAFVMIRFASVAINVAVCTFFYSALPHIEALSLIYSPTFGAGYAFVANLIASIATLLLILPYCGGVAPRVNWKLLRMILLYSLPLLVSGIAGTATEFIDRQMIKYMMPEDLAMSALGIYGAVVKLGVIMVLFTQMYRMGAEPFFLASFKKDDFKRANAEALKYFIIISITIFLGIALFADLFALILGKDFREGVYILPVVLFANVFAGIVLNLSFWYKQTGKTKYAIYVTGTGLICAVILNVIFIPKWGYFGSAWARLLCEVIMVGISYYLNRKYFPIPYDLKRIGGYFLLGAVIYAVSFLTVELRPIAKYLLNLLLVVCFMLFVVRKEKIDIVGLVKSVIKR